MLFLRHNLCKNNDFKYDLEVFPVKRLTQKIEDVYLFLEYIKF